MSWRSGAEAQRVAAGELVGERLGEQRPDLAAGVARVAVEVGLDLEQAGQHLERVPVDVEVVVRVLADAAERLELGQDAGGRAELVEQLEPAQRVGPADQQPQLGELALARRLAGARGRSARASATVAGVELEPEAAPRAGPRAGSAAGRRRSCARRPRAARRASRSASPPSGSIGSAAGSASGTAIALTVKSRRREVGLDRVAAQPGDVDVPGAVRGERPPGAELARELERGPAGGPADRARGRLRASPSTARSRSTTSRPSDRVADRAADDPGAGFARRAPLRRPRPPAARAERLGAARSSGRRASCRAAPAARSRR